MRKDHGEDHAAEERDLAASRAEPLRAGKRPAQEGDEFVAGGGAGEEVYTAPRCMEP